MWNSIGPSDQHVNYHAVWGRSADDIFVAGDAGVLVRSQDRGKTWQPIGGFGTSDLFAIAGDDKVILVAGNTGERTVISQGRGVPTQVETANRGEIFRSDDGGKTFTAIKPDAAVIVGLVTVGNDTIAVTCDASPAVVDNGRVGKVVDKYAAFLHSTDRGKTWTPETVPLTITPQLVGTRLCGVSGAIKYHAGILAYGRGGAVYERSHSGWTTRSGPPGDNISSMWWDGANALYAGMFGGIARSTDGAKTWTTIDHQMSVAGVWGASAHDLYAVGGGDHPAVLRSTDGGKAWAKEAISGYGGPAAVWGASPTEVYAVGAAGLILKRAN